MIKQTIIAVVAGGTAGHLFPALSLCNILGTTNEIIFITDKRGAKYLAHNELLKVKKIQLQNIGKTIIQKIKATFWISLAIIKCIFWLKKEKVQLVIAFGGLTNLPSLIAAKILKIPFILHEQNTILGKGNEFFVSEAEFIATSFNTTQGLEKYQSKVVVTGNPIRQEVFDAKRRKSKITKDIQILIIGGSQGAKIFDEKVTDAMVALPQILQENIILFQQSSNPELVKNSYTKSKLKQVIIDKFFFEVPQLMADSNLIITRGGATSLAEIEHLNIPAIVIPLASSANNHQLYNAKAFEETGLGKVIEEKNLDTLPILLENMLLGLEKFSKKDKNKINQAAAKLALKINHWIMKRKL